LNVKERPIAEVKCLFYIEEMSLAPYSRVFNLQGCDDITHIWIFYLP